MDSKFKIGQNVILSKPDGNLYGVVFEIKEEKEFLYTVGGFGIDHFIIGEYISENNLSEYDEENNDKVIRMYHLIRNSILTPLS
jgi:hypothetical protein